MITLAAIAAGSLGAVARYAVGLALQPPTSERPIGTAIVNVAGAVALGVLLNSDVSADTVRIVGAGFLGGFTTFSTWMVETLALAGPQRRHLGVAIANLGLVVGAGWLGFVAAGNLVG